MIPLMNNYNYNTNSESIRRSVSHLIKTAHEFDRKVGICGQAPSDDPDFLRFLVREGIDSISLNFDTFARGRINCNRTEIIEAKLSEENKKKSYDFLNECDSLIEKIRIPRGKLRNMARKQGKQLNQNLLDSTNKFDDIFNKIQNVSYDFIKEIDNGKIDKFDKYYEKFNSDIRRFKEKIPLLKREIREFGIY
jgi:hypothetical protein